MTLIPSSEQMESPPGLPRTKLPVVGEPRSIVEQSLTEAIAWCLAHVQIDNPATSLRSPEFAPVSFAPSSEPPVWILEDDRDAKVQGVVQRRHELLGRTPGLGAATDLHQGRLLAYFPRAQLSCGAAEFETDGFFDVDNTPP
jgi:hypothetical protein